MSSKRNIGIVILAAFLTGCAACEQLAIETRDSVRVEIKEHIVYRDTTVYKELPRESQTQTVRDTCSHLETSVAVSDARINPDGSLAHSLENKPVLFGIDFKMPLLRRDSVVYRNFYRVNTVEVPRPLTWWQQTQVKGFRIMLAIAIAYFIIRRWRRK